MFVLRITNMLSKHKHERHISSLPLRPETPMDERTEPRKENKFHVITGDIEPDASADHKTSAAPSGL